MLRRNRVEPALAVLLLSVFTPWAYAGEGRVVLKDRTRVRQVAAEEAAPETASRAAAAERWSELKSRYQVDEGKVARPASQASRRRSAPPIRPIPDEEPEEFLKDDWSNEFSEEIEEVAEPAAEFRADVRPATARPVDVEEALPIREFAEEAGQIAGRANRLEDSEAVLDPELLSEEEFFLLQEPDEAPADAPAPENIPDAAPIPDALPVPDAGSPDDPGYAPLTDERRLRRMTEISPHYDVDIDQDIRDFAREQAKLYNVEFRKGAFPQRNFPGFVYQWEPSNFYHYPLYFEDVPLERYGHTYNPVIQPVVSIAKFSTQLVFLPYQMTLDPICTPKYALGYYRPGECAPKLHYQPPLNAAAAAVEAGVVTGLFLAIP